MFRSLGVFNYRVWFLGALISNVGAWMQSTAQDWVVLTELTDHDATAVGITMACQFGPPLVLVGVTGWVADRFDRRTLLVLTQGSLGLLSVAIGVLLLTDVLTLPLMLVLATLFGVANAFDAPARQAFVSDIVGRAHTSNAVALNSASFNMARLIGPAVGSVLLIVVGSGWVFIVNAATFAAMLAALAAMRAGELEPRVRQRRGSGRLADGARYVWGRPDLVVTFTMAFLMGAFGMNFPIFASTMAVEFGRDADGYGLLSSALAIGSLAGALLAARRDRARLRVVMLASGGFGVFSIVSAAMPAYLGYALVCVAIGFCTVTMLTTANGFVQTTTDPALRGRVLALYLAVIMGSTPIGAPLVGAIADAWGPRSAIVVGGAAGLLAAAIGAVWLIWSGRLHRAERARFRLTIDETRPITVATPTVDPGPADPAPGARA
ncbi:MFS transporter [Microbacterium excoecariae]|uniref:MFS transporter n=1 Tax=Microbacterium excoecariae TaxID=2715210 RepID=UPI00197BF6E0|nr:MFS transporter [Microbacterium excoecariae]NHI15714.1 MFS transporter [Microbacterium excoecariae]